MMLTITPDDFRKLSESCQRELLCLLGYMDDNEFSESGDDNELIPYEDNCLRLPDESYSFRSRSVSQEAPIGAKRVIDITPEQAKDLIANISDKSIETLSRFATGEPIALDDLFGESRPYSNLSDLKRSFVGGVNRRLRTVTGNRRAVLFLTVKSDSAQSGSQIAVRAVTAASLSRALGLPGDEQAVA